eukprot:SAG31_NODE_4645_length_3075_cov_147.262433_4_plen_67_part_00
MVGSVTLELEAIRDGLHEVVSPDDLHDLTADDLQLLLSGTGTALSLADYRDAVQVFDRCASYKELL